MVGGGDGCSVGGRGGDVAVECEGELVELVCVEDLAAC